MTRRGVRIYRTLEETGAGFGPCALSIGNFDGVHAGHREILACVTAVAATHGWKPSVMTFDPHPAKVLAPGRAPRLLETPQERCRLIGEQGVRQILLLPFDEDFARLSPAEFVERVLVARLGVKAVVVGENFRFGFRQAGDVDALRALGQRFGFLVEAVEGLKVRGRMVSSSEVRRLLEAGDVARACRLLGRPYSLHGEVVAGRGVGSRETVPTLNLASNAELLPATGVYITRTTGGEHGRRWDSVTNVGFRPTFGGARLTVETFLLEAPDGEVPRRIRVEFLRRLRDERRFPDAAALKEQILRDAARAKAYFRRLAKPRRGPEV